MINSSFRGKKVLITGTTGFLGKVLLEKFLYSLDDVDTIYVLIRGKKGSTLLERFKKEIISSPCFDRLRNKHMNKFNEFIQRKVRPVQGDLLKEKVGLSKQDYKMICETCHFIINCAASIDFNARLDSAIDSNILGSLRMMNLAKNTQKLQCFTHISTCYVNCNLSGLVKEEIYPIKNDPDEQLQELLKYDLKTLVDKTSELIKGYPNTYTYTKGLCERLMQKKRQNLTMCIVRPAIINSSYLEPFPGWMDSIAAAAVLYLFAGLGILKSIYCNPNLIGDTIPVDLVSNNIIVSTACNRNTNKLTIYHVGSSDRNPVTWGFCQQIVVDYWNHNVSQSRVSKPSLLMCNNPLKLKAKRFIQRTPSWLYNKVSPILGKQHIKNASKLVKGFQRANQIERFFLFFMNKQWIYQTRKVKQLTNVMNSQQKSQFLIDAADINMSYYIVLCNYGLQKYILKESIDLPTPQNSNILKMRQNDTYFSDIKWAWTEGGVNTKNKSGSDFRNKIMSSGIILQAIDNEALRRLQTKNGKLADEKKIVTKEANDIISQLVCEFKMPVIRFMVWTLHKIFQNIYEKVNLNKDIFQQFRKIEKDSIPIVLIPTHRSYIDFLIVSYIFFAYKLQIPFVVTDSAIISMKLIPYIIKNSGAFFFKKKEYAKSRLYQVIFSEYIQRILIKGNNLQFFIEGSRSRTGKILQPQFDILDIIVEGVMSKKINEVCLIPLTINYEKVLEGDTFPSQLLGEDKVEESLLRIIKAIPLLKVNFGRVYVQFCEPIFTSSYIKGLRQTQNAWFSSQISEIQQRNNIVKKLGYHIVHKMTQKLVIMSTGVVSAVLLMNRKGITQDSLLKTVHWVSKYIVNKGFKIGGINENSAAFAVRNAMNHLSEITIKTKKSIFELQIQAGDEFQKILMLSYYRNTVIHAFLPEAFIGCSITSFGNQMSQKDGVPISRLLEQTLFLIQILQFQFILPYELTENNKFQVLINQMIKNGLLSENSEKDERRVIIIPQQQKIIAFYCSLVKPLIQCYWSVLLYLMSICNGPDHKIEVSSLQKFFNYIQWFMESLYGEKNIQNYEACSLETIKNAFKTYEKMKLVRVVTVNKKQIRIETISNIETFNELDSNLTKFIKNLFHKSFGSPLDMAKGTTHSDFAKL